MDPPSQDKTCSFGALPNVHVQKDGPPPVKRSWNVHGGSFIESGPGPVRLYDGPFISTSPSLHSRTPTLTQAIGAEVDPSGAKGTEEGPASVRFPGV